MGEDKSATGQHAARAEAVGKVVHVRPVRGWLPLGPRLLRLFALGAFSVAIGCGASDSNVTATPRGPSTDDAPSAAQAKTQRPAAGTTRDEAAAPVTTPDPRPLALGAAHTCALSDDPRTVYCFGGHRFGQLGPNAPAPKGRNATHGRNGVSFSSEVQALTAGSFHTCARLKAKGRVVTAATAMDATAGPEADVFCWGHGGYGQLGQMEDRDDHPDPLPLPTEGPVLDVVAGEMHTCVLGADFAVRCVGRAPFGQWPADEARERSGSEGPWRPVPLAGAAHRLVSGRHHLCALLADGTLSCWGADMDGQITSGRQANKHTVSATRAPTSMDAKATHGLWAYGERTCAQPSGTSPFSCWGPGFAAAGRTLSNVDGPHAPSRALVEGATPSDRPLLAGHHICLVRGDEVTCAGGNAFGQLGVGDTEPRETPVDLRLPDGVVASDVVAAAAGYRHSCLLVRPQDAHDTRLLCWGDNRLGQSCPADDAQCQDAQEAVTLPLLFGTAKNSRKNGGTD